MYTIYEQAHELLTEAFEGVYLDPKQTLYVSFRDRMAGIEEDSIAEACDEWDKMAVEEFLNTVIKHNASEYGGYQMEMPEFEALSESIIAW